MKIPECMTRRPTTADVDAANSRVTAAGDDVEDMVRRMARADRGEVYVLVAALLDATEREEALRVEVAALRKVVLAGDWLLDEASAVNETEEGWGYELDAAIDEYAAAREEVTL